MQEDVLANTNQEPVEELELGGSFTASFENNLPVAELVGEAAPLELVDTPALPEEPDNLLELQAMVAPKAEEPAPAPVSAPKQKKEKQKKQKKDKKPGFFAGLSKYKLSVSFQKKEEPALEQAREGDIVDPAQEGAGAQPAGEAKAAKPQKAKAKPKTKPKVKAAKPAKVKAAKGGKPAKGNKKILIAAMIALVVVGGGAGAFLLLGGGNDPAALLEQAQNYATEEEFGKALSTYEELAGTGELIPQAYLGMADMLVATEDTPKAIETLQTGLELVPEDETLAARLEELTPPEQEGAPKPPAYSAEPIVWADPAFEEMIRLALDRPSGSITEEDLAQVTQLKILGSTHASVRESIHAINGVNGYTIGGVEYTQRGGIATLDDIVHFKNLTRLTVGYNQISDISALEQTSLSTVSLYANNITDISPLARVEGLRHLYLYSNDISDISPLAEIPQLKSLSLQYNQIEDISSLRSLTNLEELYLSNNQIRDISPVGSMNNLAFFDARGNEIADISPIAGLAGLTDVSFAGNPVSDLSPAAHVQNLNASFGYKRS